MLKFLQQHRLALLFATAFILGVSFVGYIFLNQSFLILTGEAPFTVTVNENQVVYCDVSPCSLTITSGNQILQISKDGKKTATLELDMSWREEREVAVVFSDLPNLQLFAALPESSSWRAPALRNAEAKLFSQISMPKVSSLAELDQLLLEQKELKVLAISQNLKSVLWQQGNQMQVWNGNETTNLPGFPPKSTGYFSPAGELLILNQSTPDFPAGLSVFPGGSTQNNPPTISYPQLKMGRDGQILHAALQNGGQKAAFIEKQGDNSAIYLYDFVQNSRQLLLKKTGLIEVIFHPQDNSSLLYSKLNSETLKSEIWLLNFSENPPRNSRLDLSAESLSLQQIAFLSPTQLLFVAPQENDSGFRVQKYDLTSSAVQILYTVATLALPDRLEWSDQVLYLLINQTIYQIKSLTI